MSLDAIRALYFNATKATIQSDIAKAIVLFKSLSEEDREKAAVFMDGLSQMRSEWGVRSAPRQPARGHVSKKPRRR